MTIKRLPLLISLALFFQLSAQEPNSFSKDTKTLRKYGLSVEEDYLWLETDEESKNKWIAYQDLLKQEILGKSSFSKFGRLSYDSDYLEKETSTYDYRLSLSLDQPSILQYKEKNSIHYRTIFRAKDHARDEKDYPVVENYWAHPNAYYVIIALSHSGSDWLELLMLSLATGEIEYKITGVRAPSIYITETGFIYEKFNTPKDEVLDIPRNQRLSIHQLGTSADQDQILFQNVDRQSVKTFSWSYIEDKFFIQHPVKIRNQLKEGITCIDLDAKGPTQPFLIYGSTFRIDFDLVFLKDNIVYYRTNLRDPNYEIIGFDTDKVNAYKTYIEPYSEVLTEAKYLSEDYIGLTYLNYGKYIGVIHNKKTEERIVLDLSDGGRISFDNYDEEQNTIGYLQHYYHTSPQYGEINLNSLHSETKTYYNSNGIIFKSEVVTFKNRDGKIVPIQLFYAENKIKKGKPSPLFVEVYGGYGRITHPGYSFESYSIIRSGAILAIPGIRGSGALGAAWALEGRGLNKSNGINDVIDACEYLINHKWTDSENLIISGKSHGAFIAAAASVTRPELFKGAVVEAGPMDLIRLSRFSAGYKEVNLKEFGNPNDSTDFINLHKLSPIHNLAPNVEYPSFLLITGTNDTRVPSSHSFRFKALLDEYSSNKFNILHTTRFGHGGELLRKEYLKNLSLKFEFLYQLTGHKFWK